MEVDHDIGWRRGLSCVTLKALCKGNKGSSVFRRMSIAWLYFTLLLVAYGAFVGMMSDRPSDVSLGHR
jgi:hypothetical protein